jgi:ubiquinone/menaquinone biosynthesis C-methylase UbiE
MACALAKDLGLTGRGVDFSSQAIANANKLKTVLGLKSVEFNKFEAGEIPLNYRSDLVTCFEVLEHVKDDDALLHQLVRLSNKYVIVSVPAKQRLFSQSDVLAGHYRRYEKKPLIELLTKHDLKILSFTSYGYPYTNLIRLAREAVAKRQAGSETKSASSQKMVERSKTSGVDLLGVNKFFGSGLALFVKPTYQTSRLFDRFDLAEGYLVVCQKLN